MQCHKHLITDIQWYDHCNKLITTSAGYSNNAKIWDINSNTCIANLKAHSACVKSVVVSEVNSNLIITGSRNRSISIWDIELDI